MHADGDNRNEIVIHEHLLWVRTWARPNTCLAKRNALRRYRAAIAPVAPLDATRETVEAWFQALTTTAISRGCEIGHVAAFYRWCIEMEYRADDPTRRIRRPRPRHYAPRPIDAEQVRRALDDAPRRLRPMLLLMVGCGLRACEVAALTAGDVERHAGGGGRLFIADGKGGKQRFVPCPQPVLDSLAGLPRRGPLFTRADGRPGPLTPQRVSHLINMYLHDCGIDQTAHALRHTFATRLHGEVNDLLVVRDVLGHGSVSTTQKYVATRHGEALEGASRALAGIVA